MLLRFSALVSGLVMLVGCATATDAASISLRQMLYNPPAPRTLVVVEDAGVLPALDNTRETGVELDQVDLEASHNVMIGFNHAWLRGTDLRDGELREGSDAYVAGAPLVQYEIFSAPGTDYALTGHYRSDGAWVDVVCYGRAAIVYRLQPGAINYIPTELQPPMYDGTVARVPSASNGIAELRRILARFPIGQMEIVVPRVAAVISYEFTGGQGNGCRTRDNFTILTRYNLAE